MYRDTNRNNSFTFNLQDNLISVPFKYKHTIPNFVQVHNGYLTYNVYHCV